jgi:hypothetical protein
MRRKPTQRERTARADYTTVLCYSPHAVDRRKIRRHFNAWRKANAGPPRCDNPQCVFHTAELVWNDERLPVILDHVSGNSLDNRPNNLRFLCPNCDSQQNTRGGLNRGRVVEAAARKFTVRDRKITGRLNVHIIPPTAGTGEDER